MRRSVQTQFAHFVDRSPVTSDNFSVLVILQNTHFIVYAHSGDTVSIYIYKCL